MLTKSYIGGLTLTGAGAIVLAILLMAASTPASLGPIGVTAWFLLILVALTAVFGLAAYAVGLKLQPKRNSQQRVQDSLRRGVMVGGVITIVLSLSSLRQLNLRDVLLLVLLLVLVEFYLVARS